jgi:hypothetical protein
MVYWGKNFTFKFHNQVKAAFSGNLVMELSVIEDFRERLNMIQLFIVDQSKWRICLDFSFYSSCSSLSFSSVMESFSFAVDFDRKSILKLSLLDIIAISGLTQKGARVMSFLGPKALLLGSNCWDWKNYLGCTQD